ncbi:MAG: SMP-30/gluconolactonase/LRE family protein [Deltaproteobacteria bacterium]|nr:SMP-30/gluconolactonase/LRE family protein [Deltaproteobacteria bacterium]
MYAGEIIAEGLLGATGLAWAEGTLWITAGGPGRLLRWTEAHGLAEVAGLGGAPGGVALGGDGAIYIAQSGGERTPAAIVRVSAGGTVSVLATSVAGMTLEAPADLAFGPDGRLYFTDTRGPAKPAVNTLAGRIFAYELDSGEGTLIRRLGPVCPAGIGFSGEGELYWSEVFTRRLMRVGPEGPEVAAELPEYHTPAGFCFGSDGRLYTAARYAHCVAVIEDGYVVRRFECSRGLVTNCCIGGTSLYVAEAEFGRLWRFDAGVTGLPLLRGHGLSARAV